MGGRYLVSGVQLGLILGLDKDFIIDLVEDILKTQFIGNSTMELEKDIQNYVEAKEKWISVKDKLPLSKYKNSNVVDNFIVHFSDPNDPNERSAVAFATYVTGTGWCYLDFTPHHSADKITHWMEFPKAPKEFLTDKE